MNKKKLLSVFLISLLLIALTAACGGNQLEKIIKEAESELESVRDMLGDEMKIEISARGESTLVYTFTYLMDLLEDDYDAMSAYLKEAIESQNAVYESLLVDLKNARVKTPEVVVEYLDKHGVEIFSKNYK